MNIQILDCTLRDGGYCNNWEFGFENINYIVEKLNEANIDIIELGFLSDIKPSSKNTTIFRNHVDLFPFIKNTISLTVCMCNYGEIDFNNLEPQNILQIDGIRLAFHKKDWREAVTAGKTIIQKGYKLYLQPMVTSTYSDKELIDLVAHANNIMPEAFYIVDSFGSIKKDELLRMYYIINHSLNPKIKIGFHSHNNMQLSYSNAQSFVEIFDERPKIIDSSVFGMGRGAGNLNTELFAEYLNLSVQKNYIIEPLLQIMDNVLDNIYSEHHWGYTIPHYLSALYNCHPNYASYLTNKNKLTIESINEILRTIPEAEKYNFNKQLIEKLYVVHQSNNKCDLLDFNILKQKLFDYPIIILAPGKTINKYKQEIVEAITSKKAITISINFIPQNIPCDYAFFSNDKRWEQFENKANLLNTHLIFTSNLQITHNDDRYCVNYASLRNNTDYVEDNATLMLLKLLSTLHISDIYIAGFDGYHLNEDAYCDSIMTLNIPQEHTLSINNGITNELKKLSEQLTIHWITPSIYSDNL